MGTLVQVQLYMFSYRKGLFRPQKLPKKNKILGKTNIFWTLVNKISSEQLRKLEKIKPFSHSKTSKIKELGHYLLIFPVLGKVIVAN